MAFLDETGSTFRARLGTAWAPVGKAPILRRLSRRHEVSSIVLLVAPCGQRRPQVLARHFEGGIHAEQVISALRYFRRRVRRPLLIIWDHLPTHRSRQVQGWLARHPDDFQLEWLPAYASELNPEEGCNSLVKERLLNAIPRDVAELQHLTRSEFRRLQKTPGGPPLLVQACSSPCLANYPERF
ncbi:transposase [Pyxidicoccus parkwayensis]|uniref:Transposase n=1 Tax=Pyxidicoccus parkwayensis TaxID=2813578 RepID=A0ABX7PDJ8_9BACT|nr:transposase [Pyxidicoccus parkwaysis]QSQ28579.1 transposase [Pyxidicoccus parkwaysis]